MGFEDIRHNYILDRENAAMVADEYGIEVEVVEESGDDLFPAPIKPDLLVESHQLSPLWVMLIMGKQLFLTT